MKHILCALALLLGCTKPDEIKPPPAKALPTYTTEAVTIRSVVSEPGVERTLLLVGNRWIVAKTVAQWREAEGKTAIIVRQSDGRAFITIDELTAPIEEASNGERDTGVERNP